MAEGSRESQITGALSDIAASCSASLFGTASFLGRQDGLPNSLPFRLEELPFAVSIGFALSEVVMDSLVDRPTRTYQYHYRQVNLLIDHVLLRFLGRIQKAGYKGFPVPSSQIVDWQANTGHLSHKIVAREAGLGWIGLNNLLVSPIYGAGVRYGSLFTNAPLTPGGRGGANEPVGRSASIDEAEVPAGCGQCFRCLDSCPAGAIGRARSAFDLAKCQQMLKTFEKTENIGSMICGLCIKACRRP